MVSLIFFVFRVYIDCLQYGFIHRKVGHLKYFNFMFVFFFILIIKTPNAREFVQMVFHFRIVQYLSMDIAYLVLVQN